MSDYTKTCMFCKRNVKVVNYIGGDGYLFECDNCGKYGITLEAYQDLTSTIEKDYNSEFHLFSGAIREINDLKLPRPHIDRANFRSIFNTIKIPKTFPERLDKLLLYIERNTKRYGEVIVISSEQPAICYAKNQNELVAMIECQLEERMLKGNIRGVSLTLKGYQRCDKIRNVMKPSKQVFVAMWFNDDMNLIYENGIKKAIEENEYIPIRIDRKEHNNKIDDEIIAEIRESKFLVADYTGNRGGVYFETGYAMGLNIPVIWTVKKEELKDIHFDTRQYNFIDWIDEKDLYERLKQRIRASIIR
jgi:hypothetical protein